MLVTGLPGMGAYMERMQHEIDTEYRENFTLGHAPVPA